tara:strand:- start:615 stop:839 length:225 start_codon:yes stop_codon:yes gene_type:complete
MTTNQGKEKRAHARQKVCGKKDPGRKPRKNERWAIHMHQINRACDSFWQERGLEDPQTITLRNTGHYWSHPQSI